MVILDKKLEDLHMLFTQEQIQQRVKELAEEINQEFGWNEDLVVVGTLMGAALFGSDLIKYLTMPVQLEFIRLSSYGTQTFSSGKVKPVDLTLPSLENKNVLIVEDIVDTGLTANFILSYIKIQHKAAKVKLAALLDKTCTRTYPVEPDFVGFEIDDKFVVGYGLDYMGYFRNLPYIGYFSQ